MKFNREQVLALASAEDIEDMWHQYYDLFLADIPEFDGQTPLQLMAETIENGELGTSDDTFGHEDLGVKEEKKMSMAQLKAGLGIGGQFPGFNKFVNRNGANPWVDYKKFEEARVEEGESGEWALLDLKWHQYVALYALIRELMYEVRPTVMEGVMLADKVGVGKTGIIMSFIGLLNYIAQIDKTGKARPPALGEFPVLKVHHPFLITISATKRYLGSTEGIPDGPHVIVVPGTLISQWKDELMLWFLRHNIEILVYVGGDKAREEFWSENGPWQRRQLTGRQTVLLVSHTVCHILLIC